MLTNSGTAALILILGYRCGLRASELVGIRMRDLFASDILNRSLDGYGGVVELYASVSGSLKSDYARRRIPLTLLLAPPERLLLTEYYYQRIAESEVDSTDSFLYWREPRNRITSSFPNKIMKTLLYTYPGELPRYVFHSLRHSAFSNLILLMFGLEEQVTTFTDYNEYKDDVLDALVGSVRRPKEFPQALAQLAGHATPGQTIESYLHWLHEIIGWHLSAVSHSINDGILHNALGWSSKQIRARWNSIENRQFDGGTLRSSEFRAALIDSLSIDDQELAIRKPPVGSADVVSPYAIDHELSNDIEGFPGSAHHPFSMMQVVQYLNRVGEGSHPEDLVFKYSERKLLKRYCDRSREIFSMRSRSGQFRFVNDKKREGSPDFRMAPPRLNSRLEGELADKIFRNWNELYQRRPGFRSVMKNQINTFLYRSVATKSYIGFHKRECISVSETDVSGALYQWISLLLQLCPRNSIRLSGRNGNLCLKKLQDLGLDGKGVVIDKRNNSTLAGFRVSIRMPGEAYKIRKARKKLEDSRSNDESGRSAQKVMNSGVLKFVVPMLYITWPED